MIRTCIQTVADDMCREWIQVEGGEDESADNVKTLQDLQENKYRLRKLFNEALSIVGFMGGAFIFVDTGVEGESLKLPLNFSDKFSRTGGRKISRSNLIVIDPSMSRLVFTTPASRSKTIHLKRDLGLFLVKRCTRHA